MQPKVAGRLKAAWLDPLSIQPQQGNNLFIIYFYYYYFFICSLYL